MILNFTENLIQFTSDELLPVSKLSQKAFSIVNQVKEKGNRKILTRNGTPVAALIPLSMLVYIEQQTRNMTNNDDN